MPKRKAARRRGSVRQLAPGRFEVRWWNPVTKRQHSRTLHCATAREADAELARIMDVELPGEVRTVRQVVDGWLEATAHDKTARTIYEQRVLARRHLYPHLGEMDAAALTAAKVEDWQAKLAAAGLSTGSRRHAHDVLIGALRWAQKRKYVTIVPDVSAPTPRRKAVRPPDPADLGRVIAAADARQDGRLGLLMRLLIDTGARLGELIGLQWGDVLWSESAIIVRQSASRVPGALPVAKTPKTERARRVAVSAAGLAVLGALSAWDERNGYKTGADDFVFPHYRSLGGVPDTPSGWTQRWIKARKAANLPPMRLHDLRHLAASVMLDEGFTLSEVSSHLGHARVSTTLDIYGHLVRDRGAARAEVLGRLYQTDGEGLNRS